MRLSDIKTLDDFATFCKNDNFYAVSVTYPFVVETRLENHAPFIGFNKDGAMEWTFDFISDSTARELFTDRDEADLFSLEKQIKYLEKQLGKARKQLAETKGIK